MELGITFNFMIFKIITGFIFIFYIVTGNTVFAQWKQSGCTELKTAFVSSIASSGKTIIAGTYSGIFVSTDNGESWKMANKGLANTGIQTVAIKGNLLLSGPACSGVFISSDFGENWTAANEGLQIGSYDITEDVQSICSSGDKLFILTGCLVNGDVNGGLFISSDDSKHWIQVNEILNNKYGRSLFVENNNIFAGTDDGYFFSRDAGANWTTPLSEMTQRTVYATSKEGNNICAGTDLEAVILSTDNGLNWKKCNEAADFTDIRSIVSVGGVFLAGSTIGGVYISQDNGLNWIKTGEGLNNKSIMALTANDEYIFAGTMGGGIYRAKLSDLEITDVEDSPRNINSKLIVYPNPTTEYLNIFCDNVPLNNYIEIFDIHGICIFKENIVQNSIKIDINDFPTGVYLIKSGNNKNIFVKI